MGTDFSPVVAGLNAMLAINDGLARRVFHGRGGCYQGLEWLTIDDFGEGLWLVLFREPPAELWSQLVDDLKDKAECRRAFACVQHRYAKPIRHEFLWGDLPATLTAKEGPWQFELQLGSRQNTGYFMDASPGRSWLAARCEGKSVLNLFAYTCAFSVAAVDGGARSVVNVDMSRSSLNAGRRNHQLNQQPLGSVRFLGYDIFRSWSRIRSRGPYDIVVVDPPSFQRGSFDARKDYARVLKRIPELAVPGAELLLCLNAPYLDSDFLRELLAEHLPASREIAMLGGRPDFPEQSLKMLHCEYWPD